MSVIAVNSITDAAGGNTATINGTTPTADSLQGFRNRILNGSMVLNQRALGTFTPTTAGSSANYSIDRWTFQLNQSSKLTTAQSTTAPTGFTNSLLVTSSSAYTASGSDYFALTTRIEGQNVADLGFGTAAAQAVTLSFWVRSSLTGTFAGNINNSGASRSYPFAYSIAAADTWELKTVTIAGDTSGTWLTTNGTGIELNFSMGMGSTYGSGTAGAWTSSWSFPSGAVSVVGTSGATFYITGVQLEAGSVATPFERRPFGAELALCQRYFYKWANDSGNVIYNLGLQAYSSSAAFGKLFDFPVVMRAAPTAVASGDFQPHNATGASQAAFTSTGELKTSTNSVSTGAWDGSSGLVAGNAAMLRVNTNAVITLSAEL